MKHITAETLKKFLAYNPDTGVFVWIAGRRAGYKAGGFWNNGYVRIKVEGETYCAHALAWLFVTGEYPDLHIDHIDRDKGNNRFSNLRLATVSQNHGNKLRQRNNRSGLKGVHQAKDGAWVATCKGRYLGRFGTPESAYDAYVAKSISEYGEFSGVS